MYICNRVAAVNTKPNDDGKLRLKLCSHGQKLQTECSDGWSQTHLGHKKYMKPLTTQNKYVTASNPLAKLNQKVNLKIF